jgi:hypothetical protein
MSRDRDHKPVQRRPAEAAEEAADAGRFVRGLTIGLIVGAVIAGSTLWRRFGPLRTRS